MKHCDSIVVFHFSTSPNPFELETKNRPHQTPKNSHVNPSILYVSLLGWKFASRYLVRLLNTCEKLSDSAKKKLESRQQSAIAGSVMKGMEENGPISGSEEGNPPMSSDGKSSVRYSPLDQKGWNLKKWSPGKISSMACLALMNVFLQWEGIHRHGLGLGMIIFSSFSHLIWTGRHKAGKSHFHMFFPCRGGL